MKKESLPVPIQGKLLYTMLILGTKQQYLCAALFLNIKKRHCKIECSAIALNNTATHRSCCFDAAIKIMYPLSWKGRGGTIRILFDSENSAKIWDEFFVFGKAERRRRSRSLRRLVRSKADAKKSPKEAISASHRNCHFVAITNIMYTLSWKGCGGTILYRIKNGFPTK